MFRIILAGVAALALPLAFATAAQAHASRDTTEAQPGGIKAVLGIPHGCDGKPTDTVRVDIPEGFIDAKPMPKAGWTLTVEKGAYAQTSKLHGADVIDGAEAGTWSGGSLSDDFSDKFVIKGKLAGATAGQTLYIMTTPQCGADEVVWGDMPAECQNPHELDHPAPAVRVAAGSDQHAGHNDSAMAVTAGDLQITAYWAKIMLPGQPAGAGYLSVTNKGSSDDTLLSAASPAAGKVEVHTMEIVNDVMTMRPFDGGLKVAAGATVELKPGGLHLMFTEVKDPFKDGATVPLTLEFEKAGKIEIALPVRKAAGAVDHSQH